MIRINIWWYILETKDNFKIKNFKINNDDDWSE